VTRDNRCFVHCEVAFDGVQIGVAKAASVHFDAHLAGTGSRDRKVSLAERIFFDRTRVLKN